MGRSYLDNVVFELTGACNQCCRFCYNYWRDGSSPIPPPDPRLCSKTLRRLLSQSDIRRISFSGGEPLLLSNIHDLALRARFKGCGVNILTNGTLLSDEALANFISIGVSTIQIPLLSADSGVHDYLTGQPGSHAKALSALRRVGAAGIGAAVLVITRVNAGDIGRTLSLVRECGIETVMVNRFNLGGNGIRNEEELVPDRETLVGAFSVVEDFAAENTWMHFVSGVCTPLCLLDTASYPHIIFSRCTTDLSGRPVTVDYKGDVRFCNHSPRVLGNIYSQSIPDILSDPVTKAYYGQVPSKCGDCPLFQRCGGGCRAASEQVYGTFSALDPILEVVK